MNKQIIKNYTKLSSYKPSLSFHRIPYHLQYETRDFNTKAKEPSIKTLMNREKYIKNFNPYLKSNVTGNLDPKIADFYRKIYSKR
tara:strand:- start:478 stop:732 length:255 start_codon:yes stop_codon:yes gene_type:complete